MLVLFRVLGFRRVPPAVGRRVHIPDELQKNTKDKELKDEFIVSPGKRDMILDRYSQKCFMIGSAMFVRQSLFMHNFPLYLSVNQLQ